jgi:8-oxo-dGTP diphosphatase
MNTFNYDEFLKLSNRFSTKPLIDDITLEFPTDSFFNKMSKSVNSDRRGEVVFCVIRPNGKIITVTCADYPQGIFRIPTGGIGHNEDIYEALFREVKEELGLEVEVLSFPKVLRICFKHKDNAVMFYSYVFILKETGGNLLLDATDDEVSEVKEVSLDELNGIKESLSSITGSWTDWGKFRFLSVKAAYSYLIEKRFMLENYDI